MRPPSPSLPCPPSLPFLRPSPGPQVLLLLFFYLLSAALLPAVSAPPAPPPPEGIPVVPLWGRFEGRIDAPRPYRDPFREVSLQTSFLRPDGSAIAFWGFYDGGNTWGFRMLADQIGPWSYHARLSDGSAETSGSFHVVASSLPGVLEVHPANPRWFGRRGGSAHLVRALHVGDRFFARNFPPEDRARFLEFASTRGYNLLSVASHYLNRAAENRGRGWETPGLWPLNPAEFARLETLLDLCARSGFDVYPFAGFFGKSSVAPRDPAGQDLYLRYTLARLGPYSNILLNVAGPEPNLQNNVYLESFEVDRLGRLIASLDPFRHPLSVHNETGDDEFKHASWSTFGTLQGPKTLDRQDLGRGLRKNLHWAKPLFAQETLWAGNRNHPAYSLEDLRKNAWVILFSGAQFCFADNAGNSSTGFSGNLDPAHANLEAHAAVISAWDGFSRLPFARLRPHYEVTPAGWCLAEPGRQYFLYFDQPVAQLALNLPPGPPFHATWIHPLDPTRTVSAPPFTPGATIASPPGFDDALLHLQSPLP